MYSQRCIVFFSCFPGFSWMRILEATRDGYLLASISMGSMRDYEAFGKRVTSLPWSRFLAQKIHIVHRFYDQF